MLNDVCHFAAIYARISVKLTSDSALNLRDENVKDADKGLRSLGREDCETLAKFVTTLCVGANLAGCGFCMHVTVTHVELVKCL